MLGSLLQSARKERGLSLGALAQRSGVHKSTLSRWESGKTLPYAPELKLVMDTLQLSEAQRRACWSTLPVPRAARHVNQASPTQTLPISGGELLRTLRRRAGRTQAETAQAVGVTQALLSRWEGNDSVPDPEKRDRLCEFLGATAAERQGFQTRAWTLFEELPLDKAELDARIDQLEHQDTFQNRDLTYLAFASRYEQLYRANEISESHARAVWGNYGHYVCWHGRFTDAERLVQPTMATLEQTRGQLNQGQISASFALATVYSERQEHARAFEMLFSIRDRIPQRERSRWLDELAQIAYAFGQVERAFAAFEESANHANSLQEERLRRQRGARLLCQERRYGAALKQLERAPSCDTDPRVSVVIERQLTTAWALAGTADPRAADQQLRETLPLVERHHFADLTALAQQLQRQLARA